MRKKSRKTSAGIVLIFVFAFILSALTVHWLPLPPKWTKLVFFLLVPAVSAAGVFILCIINRGKRR